MNIVLANGCQADSHYKYMNKEQLEFALGVAESDFHEFNFSHKTMFEICGQLHKIELLKMLLKKATN